MTAGPPGRSPPALGEPVMSNPSTPQPPQPPQPTQPPQGRPAQPGQPGIVSDPDVPNRFGPDQPNVRDDDPKGGQTTPQAPPPSPPAEPLEDDQIAPEDEG